MRLRMYRLSRRKILFFSIAFLGVLLLLCLALIVRNREADLRDNSVTVADPDEKAENERLSGEGAGKEHGESLLNGENEDPGRPPVPDKKNGLHWKQDHYILIGRAVVPKNRRKATFPLVLIFELGGKLAGETRTDPRGEYSIKLAPGKYVVTVRPPEGSDFEGISFEVNLDEPIVRQDFTLEEPYRPPAPTRIRGVVLEEGTSKPVPLAVIEIRSYHGDPYYNNKIDVGEDGTFCAEVPPPVGGKYTIYAKAEGYRADNHSPYVKANRDTEVSFSLLRLALLSGRVVDKVSRRPISGAEIRVPYPSKSANSCISGTYGDYSIYVKPGPNTISARAVGYKNIEKGGRNFGSEFIVLPEVDVPPEGLVFDIEMVPFDAAIDIIVLDAVTNKPVSGARATTSAPGDSFYFSGLKTDDKGRVKTAYCAEGMWLISAFHPDYYPYVSEWFKVESGEVFEYEVYLEPRPPATAVITGRVIDVDTNFPANVQKVTISICPAYYDRYGMYYGPEGEKDYKRIEIQSAAAGYSFTLTPGEYILWAWARPRPTVGQGGYLGFKTRLTLDAETELFFDIPLKKCPAIDDVVVCIVVDARDGSPISGIKCTILWEGYETPEYDRRSKPTDKNGRMLREVPCGRVFVTAVDTRDPPQYRMKDETPVVVDVVKKRGVVDTAKIEMVPIASEEK